MPRSNNRGGFTQMQRVTTNTRSNYGPGTGLG